jgi:hypothetical protein
VASGSYDGLVDKGTLDAILCGAGSSRSSMMMLAECCRVLSPRGALMCITYGDPIARLQYLDKALYGWSVEVRGGDWGSGGSLVQCCCCADMQAGGWGWRWGARSVSLLCLMCQWLRACAAALMLTPVIHHTCHKDSRPLVAASLQYVVMSVNDAAVHPAQVYYIAQVQEAEEDAGVEDGCGDSAPATLLRGPFNAKQPEVMAALSQLAKVHYVYVCRKSPALIARALQAVEAQRQQEAALRAAQAGQQAGGEVGVGVGGEARGPADGEAAVVVVDRKAAQERS